RSPSLQCYTLSLHDALPIYSLTIAHSLLLPFTMLQIGLLAVGALRLLDGQNQRLAAALQEQESLLETAAASEQLLHNIIDSVDRSEEHTSELQSRFDLVCRL